MIEPWAAGTIIFSGTDDAKSIAIAKAMIAFHEFTKDDVRLFRRDGQVIVQMLRDAVGKETIGAWEDWKDVATDIR